MKSVRDGIKPAAEPSGTGCVECTAAGKWWFHLRRCAECGHIGCCDSSPSQHASKHYAATGHPIITSFEPGEHWFYDYRTQESFAGPKLAAPHSHPVGSTDAGTGWSGAFKLANAASRIEDARRGLPAPFDFLAAVTSGVTLHGGRSGRSVDTVGNVAQLPVTMETWAQIALAGSRVWRRFLPLHRALRN
jgi:hypothetical protein